MTGLKTNERPGTRAVARYIRISPYKVREVLDLIRGQHVQRAAEILRFSERDAALVVGKLLASAVANAENNDAIDPEELYVSACFADEGTTIKRFRPRARGRAGRIRKRTCHITIIVSRMPADQLARYRTKQAAEQAARRARRVAGGRGGAAAGAEGGRAGRFRRTRGGVPGEGGGDRRGTEAEQLTEAEEAELDEVESDAEAAEEAGVVENSPVPHETAEAEESADDTADEATEDVTEEPTEAPGEEEQ
jgi:large subunit ribosomal protein L22